MFTVDQINAAHEKVKSGADFPKYIQEIKGFGVTGFETWVYDSHTQYFGANSFATASASQYPDLTIEARYDKEKFEQRLKIHQQGQTDYYTFCKDCADTGVEKWFVDLDKLTCTYYDTLGNAVLEELIPQ